VTVNQQIDQLVVAIIAGERSDDLSRQLVSSGYYFTRIDSSGGFLEGPTTSLLVGINGESFDDLFKVIQTCCRRTRRYIPAQVEAPPGFGQPVMIEAEVGGAVVYSLDVERFEQF
jgi:uncharacterized protein YaaQ